MPDPVALQQHVVQGHRPGPHLLLTGGVHGDEFEPMVALRRLMRLLEPQRLAGKVTIVPVVNEAAFRRCHRTADDGLDLARTCPGRPEGSITQRVAFALSQLIRAADYYIDLHTGGTTLAVYPLAGYMLHPNGQILERQRQMARAFNLPVVWGTDPHLDGRSMSVARDAGVPAIYVEYYGSAVCRPEGVEAYVSGCLNVMAALGMLEGHHAPVASAGDCVKYVVEDARPGAGHMQRCNLSPLDGYFETAVQLGDHIRAGEPLGHVVDVLGVDRQIITAAETGLVLVLRTFPSVKQGDSLAVILPLEPAPGLLHVEQPDSFRFVRTPHTPSEIISRGPK